jgi:hypothetical protein
MMEGGGGPQRPPAPFHHRGGVWGGTERRVWEGVWEGVEGMMEGVWEGVMEG